MKVEGRAHSMYCFMKEGAVGCKGKERKGKERKGKERKGKEKGERRHGRLDWLLKTSVSNYKNSLEAFQTCFAMMMMMWSPHSHWRDSSCDRSLAPKSPFFGSFSAFFFFFFWGGRRLERAPYLPIFFFWLRTRSRRILFFFVIIHAFIHFIFSPPIVCDSSRERKEIERATRDGFFLNFFFFFFNLPAVDSWLVNKMP